jgi:hypothetical protein
MGVDTKDNAAKIAEIKARLPHAVIRNAVADPDAPWADVPPHIYDSLTAKFNLREPSVEVTKRDRHRAGRVTQRVWESLVYDPVTGTVDVDPTKAVPFTTLNTGELPTIDPAGEPGDAS